MWMVPKTASESHLAALRPQQPRTAAAKPTLSLPPTPQQPSVSVTAAAAAVAGGGGEEERKGGEAAVSHMGCGYLQLPTATKRRHSWICG